MISDLLLVLGSAATAAGAWLYHPGAGLIVAGLFMLLGAWLLATPSPETEEDT